MEFKEHFLPEDISKAKKEFDCVADLLMLVILNVRSGRMEIAVDRSEELMHSLRELNHLSIKKYNSDRYQELVNELVQKGIDAELVRMVANDR